MHALNVSIEGEREVAEDGAIPAHEHFPQAGGWQDAEGAQPRPQHSDWAEARCWWHHYHERKSARCSGLHVWRQNPCSVEEGECSSAPVLCMAITTVGSMEEWGALESHLVWLLGSVMLRGNSCLCACLQNFILKWRRFIYLFYVDMCD